MTAETIFIFIMSLILLWIKPGPGQALKITRALNDGFLSGFYVAMGITTACVIFFLVAVLGTSVLTNFFNDISLFLKLLGGSYLIYLGYKGLKNIESGQWKGRLDKSNKKKFFENFSLGFFLSLANPLDIVYFLGIMPTLVPLGEFTTQDIAMGVLIVIAVPLIVDGTILLLVHQTKEALSDTAFVKKINSVTSIGFILIGLFLIFSAFF